MRVCVGGGRLLVPPPAPLPARRPLRRPPRRSMPPRTGLVVGAPGELLRNVKQFVSDCAEKGSISLGRFGCCRGEDQARGMIANFINRAFGLWSGLLAQRGSGPARGSDSCHGLGYDLGFPPRELWGFC